MHFIPYVLLVLFLLIIVAVKIEFFGTKDATPRSLGVRLVEVLLLTLFFILLLIALLPIIAFPFTLAALWSVFARAMKHSYARALGMLLLFGLSRLVYFVKQSFLHAYAVVEIITGLLVGWGALGAEAVAAGGLIQGAV